MIAPLVSLIAVSLIEHDRVALGRTAAAIALLPHLLLFTVPHLAFVPFHPIVLAFTLTAWVALMVAG